MIASRFFQRVLPLPALLAALTLAPSARADIPPPDVCGHNGPGGTPGWGGVDDPGLAGTPCDNTANDAGPGVCTLSTCKQYHPDGGAISVPCYVCEAVDAGPESDASAPDASPPDGGVPTPIPDPGPVQDAGADASALASPSIGPVPIGPATSGSCTISAPLGRDEAIGASMLALGVVALAFGRRKKS